ncbi:TPA: hypothetical protein EYP75_03975 [Candidatus Bathyarchaeota archaeon]|nr:hypothetical protein [Candidatus Bathyarchaeota archaeon]
MKTPSMFNEYGRSSTPNTISFMFIRIKQAGALDAITMAIWDLIGKSLEKPLYKLWGGAFRKRIPFWGWVHRAPLTRWSMKQRIW